MHNQQPGVHFNKNTKAPPVWAGDFGGREHVMPFPAKIDPAQFSNYGGFTIQTAAAAAIGATALTVDALPTRIISGTMLNFGTWAPVVVTVGAAGALAGATSVPVDALSGPIPSGTLLDFGTDKFAILTAAAAAAATSITVRALPTDLVDNDTATFRGGTRQARVTVTAEALATSLTVDELQFAIPDDTKANYSPTGKLFVKAGVLVGRTYAERGANTPFGPWASGDDEVFLTYFPVDDAHVNADVELYRPDSLVKENYLPDWEAIAADSAMLAVLRATYQCIKGVD